MNSIVGEIKEKKELSDIPDDLVISALNEYLRKHRIEIPIDKKPRKALIKIIRAELRRYAGQYSISSKSKKDNLLVKGNFNELLKHHISTKERINDYEILKEIISRINPQSILDLGCGLNPLAIASKGVSYHAYDIKKEDLDIVSTFFSANDINGDTHNIDIRKIKNFPGVDLCLIMKVLDIIGQNKTELAHKFLTEIRTKYFIISFATKTISGKKMNRPYRRWFENLLKELNYQYKIIRTNQEIFYIISL